MIPDANVHLLGFIPDGSRLMYQADVLLVGSQEWESFGWTVIEAMVRGVPVVSTNAGGLAEVIGPTGVAGFSVDKSDVKGFSNGVEVLLSNPDERSKMISNGRLRAKEKFTVERMAQEYASLIRQSPE